MKPRLFIGSSTEGLRVAHAIQEELEHDAHCVVWTQAPFGLSGIVVDDLLRQVSDFDFAVFVFHPDDLSLVRGEIYRTVRDNVLLEVGMFMGGLGRERVFVGRPRGGDEVRLPTDLLGMLHGDYDPPTNPKDLRAGLGAFCNKVRTQMAEVGTSAREVPETVKCEARAVLASARIENVAGDSPGMEPTEVEHGVWKQADGRNTITVKSTEFFELRFATAFPGVRGVRWFDSQSKALERLARLLKDPVQFDDAVGHKVTGDPIWWWRGRRDCRVGRFERLDTERCIMDFHELRLGRVAAYRSGAYYKSFVYVETVADDSTGFLPTDTSSILAEVAQHGFASEPYAVHEGRSIRREFHDDGAAEIDGELVAVEGSEARIRYLTPYNFLLAAKFSPLNSERFRSESGPMLEAMLRGEDRIQELIALVESFHRHELDD